MGLALLGSVKLALAQKLRIDEAQVGGLVSLFGFTMIPVILTTGFLTDLMGRQVILIGGTILMALGLLVLAASRRYATALVSVLLLSAAWAAQINVINVLVPHVLQPPAFLSGDIPAISFATNLGNVFFGLGAFLTPLTVSWAFGRLGLASGLRLLAGLVVLQAVMAGLSEFPAAMSAGEGGSVMSSETWSLLGDPIMWLCAMALFFHGPLEAAMGAWTTTFLGNRGVPEARAATLLSAFWLAFMASRLFTAFVLGPSTARVVSGLGLETRSEAVLILVLALGCVGITSGLVISRGRWAAAWLDLCGGHLGRGLVSDPADGDRSRHRGGPGLRSDLSLDHGDSARSFPGAGAGTRGRIVVRHRRPGLDLYSHVDRYLCTADERAEGFPDRGRVGGRPVPGGWAPDPDGHHGLSTKLDPARSDPSFTYEGSQAIDGRPLRCEAAE